MVLMQVMGSCKSQDFIVGAVVVVIVASSSGRACTTTTSNTIHTSTSRSSTSRIERG
jgi:hypothetical protein